MGKVSIGIIGGAGYTAGELLRILVHHPNVEIKFVHSRSKAGFKIADVFSDLLGDTEMVFSDNIQPDVDVVFLCSGHGEAIKIMLDNPFNKSTKIIDLSQDFRIPSDNTLGFVYGLPELNKKDIQNAKNIANPGCFATAIQLSLIPLAANNLLKSDIHISATTGSTGAGQALGETSHFSWRDNNLSVYKPFNHQHLAEINQSLTLLQPTYISEIIMIPQRGAFSRGIFACTTLNCDLTIEHVRGLYESYYEHHPFTHISQKNIDLKQVVNTNKCILYMEKYNDQLMIISVIDNLLKGASGQAVQNMNLMLGFDETMGLKLKASAF